MSALPLDSARPEKGGIPDQVRSQCRTIAEQARVVAGSPRAILLLYDDTIRRLVTVATTGADFPLQQVAISLIRRNYPGIDPLDLSYRPTVNPAVAAAFVGQRTQVNTMAEAYENIYPPGIAALAQGLVGITHVVSCPVSYEGRALGLIRFLVPALPTGERQALMEAAASQIALTISNARQAEQAKRQLAAFRAVGEVSRRSIRTGSAEMLVALADLIRDLTSADDAVIYLVENDMVTPAAESVSDEARERGQVRVNTPSRKVGAGLMGWVIASGEPAFIPDARLDPRTRSNRQVAGREAVIAVPMRTSGRTRGCIRLGVVGRRRFTEDDLWLAQAFADEAMQALDLAHAQERALIAAYAAGAQRAPGAHCPMADGADRPESA
jgi:GAF domain-containing protein